jgi:hypothetical protein
MNQKRKMKYSITLMLNNHTLYKMYKSTILPNIEDTISISETEMFVVEKRILHINNDESITLIGKINTI